MTLKEEEQRATELLAGLTVKHVWRHSLGEALVVFGDGTLFYANAPKGVPLELSVVEGCKPNDNSPELGQLKNA